MHFLLPTIHTLLRGFPVVSLSSSQDNQTKIYWIRITTKRKFIKVCKDCFPHTSGWLGNTSYLPVGELRGSKGWERVKWICWAQFLSVSFCWECISLGYSCRTTSRKNIVRQEWRSGEERHIKGNQLRGTMHRLQWQKWKKVCIRKYHRLNM